ncbi:MAG: YCF48-related protein [Terracidiphilus sp.]|jgi:photosystem II stability/assembly factor-like uncharacterized protein
MNEMDHHDAHETAVRVFVSYAREDKRWLDPDYRYNLIPFLAESLRRHNVVFWYDTELKPGDVFKRQIESEIDQAQIAVLIVSQSFLNSEFIEQIEMPRIAERARRGHTIVIPVLVEPCDWSDYPFLADRQMVPSANPLIDFTESEAKWAKVKFQILDGLKAQLKRIREASESPATAGAGIDAQRPAKEKRISSAAIGGAGERDAVAIEERTTRSGSAVRSPWERIPVWAWGVAALAILAISFALLRGHFGSQEALTSARSGTPERLTSIFGTSDGKKLWAVGNSGVVIESDDGGVAWSARTSGTPSHLESIFGTSDGKMLVAVGDGGTIVESEDGGATWTSRASGTRNTLLSNFGTSDGKQQWAVSAKGEIFGSDNAGATWTRQSAGATDWLGSIYGISDGSRLWAVGDHGTVLESDDEGATWALDHSPLQASLSAVFAIGDGKHLWAVTSGSAIASDDGGATWTMNAMTPSTASPPGIHAVFGSADGKRIWAVGDSGTILASEDGGSNWQVRKSGTQNVLCSIYGTSDGTHLWIVGDNGIVLTSNDGGMTWTK